MVSRLQARGAAQFRGLIHALPGMASIFVHIHAPERLLLATFRPVRSYWPKLMLAGILPVSWLLLKSCGSRERAGGALEGWEGRGTLHR